ncbi:MAG: hypothetical protein ACPG4T_10355, partial [Nannocystaceae bacterium]
AIPFAEASVDDVMGFAASNADYVVRLADVLGASPRDILLTSASSGIGLGDEPRSGGLAYEIASLTEPEPVAPEVLDQPAEPILDQALEPTLDQPAEA